MSYWLSSDVNNNSKALTNSALLLLFYVFAIILTAGFHEPWMDELHSWVLARDLSFKELLAAMREEGHFCLWYLLLMPFAKSGCSVIFLQVISVSLSAVAAFLLVFKTDFSVAAKAAVLFSFPMIWSFPAVSRCYALVPPILFGIALLYKDLEKNKFLFAILLGLLAHTHAYMEGMVLALFLVYIYQVIWPKYQSKTLTWKDLLPPAIVLVFVLLAFLQVMRNPFSDVVVRIGDSQVVLNETHGIKQTVKPFIKFYSIVPIKDLSISAKTLVFYSLSLLPAVVLSCLIFLSFNGIGRFVALVSIGWQIAFSLFIYSFGLQRVHLLLFIVIAIFIMSGKVEKKENLMVICLCVLASVSGYFYYLVADIKHPYSNWKPLSEAIERMVPEGEPVYSAIYFGDNVSVYLSDPKVKIIQTPIDSVKRDPFYAIWWNSDFDNPEFKTDILYGSEECVKENFALLKIKRKEPVIE